MHIICATLLTFEGILLATVELLGIITSNVKDVTDFVDSCIVMAYHQLMHILLLAQAKLAWFHLISGEVNVLCVSGDQQQWDKVNQTPVSSSCYFWA